VSAQATARAALWAILSTAGAKLITLIGVSLLAHLLAPHEFGLLAFALYWPDRRDDAARVPSVARDRDLLEDVSQLLSPHRKLREAGG
jgi:hypothetical protein